MNRTTIQIGWCVGLSVPLIALLPGGCLPQEPDRSGLDGRPGLGGECWTGPAGARGVGDCRSGFEVTYADAQGAVQTVCFGEQLPLTESCNSRDDDCDGQTDEENVCQARLATILGDLGDGARIIKVLGRAGAGRIVRPGGAPLNTCQAETLDEETRCVDDFVATLAPGYGMDGLSDQFERTGIQLWDGGASYFYRQVGQIQRVHEGAEFVPVLGTWLRVEVSRPADSGSAEVLLRSVSAFVLPVPTDRSDPDAFDEAWLPVELRPTSDADPPELVFGVQHDAVRGEEKPELAYRVQAGGQVLLVQAAGEHRVMARASNFTDDVQIQTSQTSLPATGVIQAAIAAIATWTNDLKELCDIRRNCPLKSLALGDSTDAMFHFVIHTVNLAVRLPDKQIRWTESSCNAPCPACSNTEILGFYRGTNKDDLFLHCASGPSTALHEAGHRATRVFWEAPYPACGDNRECNSMLEYFSQQSAAFGSTSCGTSDAMIGDTSCTVNADWSTGWHENVSDPETSMTNFDQLYAIDQYRTASIVGRAMYLYWQSLGGNGRALDKVNLLYWTAVPRLRGLVEFTDWYNDLDDACQQLRAQKTAYVGPHCTGRCNFFFDSESCVLLRTAFKRAGIIGCEQPAPYELCNGQDDDCDGDVDRDVRGNELVKDCYDGPPETLGVGQCRGGFRTCVKPDAPRSCENGQQGQEGCWEADCQGSVVPAPEVCDHLDNDCDHLTDEEVQVEYAFDGDGDTYPSAQAHRWYCRNEAPRGWIVADLDRPLDCNDQDRNVHPDAVEVCPGVNDRTPLKDENCDGVVNEGCGCHLADPPRLCGPVPPNCLGRPEGTAGCEPYGTENGCRAGRNRCVSRNGVNTWDTVCEGEQWGGPEVCNGRDDDCNGVVDDNVAGLGRCGFADSGQEICVQGRLSCEGAQTPNACGGSEPLDPQPGAECGQGGVAVCAGPNDTTCINASCSIASTGLTTPRFYVPPLVGGDAEFNGNGPHVESSARVAVTNGVILLDLCMEAQEIGDDTHVRGCVSQALVALPANCSVTQLLVDDPVSHCTYDDTTTGQDDVYPDNLSSQTCDVSPVGPVSRWRFVGDTDGDEGGLRTGVEVTLAPISYEYCCE